MVREADPNYTRLSRQPWVYEFSNGRLFIDPLQTYGNPIVVVGGLYDDGGVLALDVATSWPTSQAGLSAGQVWSNGGVCSVVQPAAPYPLAQPVYWDQTSSVTLLALGGSNLPIEDPRSLNQIWNSGGEIWISNG